MTTTSSLSQQQRLLAGATEAASATTTMDATTPATTMAAADETTTTTTTSTTWITTAATNNDAIPPFIKIPRQRAKPFFFSPRRTSLSLRKCGIQGYILLNNEWHNNQIPVQVRGTTTINWCWGIILIQKAGGLKSCSTRCRGRCFKWGKGYKWKEGRGFRMVVRAETLGTLSRETIYLANKIKRIRIAMH